MMMAITSSDFSSVLVRVITSWMSISFSIFEKWNDYEQERNNSKDNEQYNTNV